MLYSSVNKTRHSLIANWNLIRISKAFTIHLTVNKWSDIKTLSNNSNSKMEILKEKKLKNEKQCWEQIGREKDISKERRMKGRKRNVNEKQR